MKIRLSKPLIVGAFAMGAVAFWMNLPSAPELELVSEGGMLRITNIGRGPTEILKLTINNRADCKPLINPGLFAPYRDFDKPQTLKSGDFVVFAFSGCNVIIARAQVTTRKGSFEYKFE
jgi:hypothetical protein